MNIRTSIFCFIVGFLFFLLSFQPLVWALENNEFRNGAKIFEVNCAGCHPHGNNIIRRGKNLKKRTLEKNKLDSVEAISYLVANGKNNMSAFGDRLTDKQINEVANYVLSQAKNNWK